MRGKKAKPRVLKPDMKYKSVVVTKLINYTMKDGKKTLATQIIYEAMQKAAKDLKKKDPLQVLETAINNVKPNLEVRSRRIGGANYQVPVQVSEARQLTLALRWILNAARTNRGGVPFSQALAREIVSAFKKEGSAIKKKQDVEKMAEANRAFAHFQW